MQGFYQFLFGGHLVVWPFSLGARERCRESQGQASPGMKPTTARMSGRRHRHLMYVAHFDFSDDCLQRYVCTRLFVNEHSSMACKPSLQHKITEAEMEDEDGDNNENDGCDDVAAKSNSEAGCSQWGVVRGVSAYCHVTEAW